MLSLLVTFQLESSHLWLAGYPYHNVPAEGSELLLLQFGLPMIANEYVCNVIYDMVCF